MSSTRRGAVRFALDDYQTQPELALFCAKRLVELADPDPTLFAKSLRILEPSAGPGVFVTAFQAACPTAVVDAVEINEEKYRDRLSLAVGNRGTAHFADFLTWKPPTDPYNVAGGNPPFAREVLDEAGEVRLNKNDDPIMEDAVEDHADRALGLLAPGGVLGFVLRLAWSIPLTRDERRRIWFGQGVPLSELGGLRPRPKFVGKKGQDSAEYALTVWRRRTPSKKERPDDCVFRFLPRWRPERVKRGNKSDDNNDSADDDKPNGSEDG